MKIKWMELTKDDPIFRQDFIISNQSYKHSENQKSNTKLKKKKVKKNLAKKSMKNKKKRELNAPL